jgi:hypothetical protein
MPTAVIVARLLLLLSYVLGALGQGVIIPSSSVNWEELIAVVD